MQKLKILLQHNLFTVVLFIFIIVYILTYDGKTNIDINKKYFEGIITNYKFNNDNLVLEVKGREKIIANYYFKGKEDRKYSKRNIVLGSKIKLYGTFKYPTSNTIPNTFNYQRYLKSKKIYVTMNIDKIKLNKKCNIFYIFKNKLIKYINNKKNKEYYYIFILGDKTHLDTNIYDIYKENGITHIFAISGMHISMIIVILKKLKLKNLLIICILYYYAFLVMFTPSVLRVCLFYTLKSIFKNTNNAKLLFYTAFILVLLNPYIIFDIGFIYSFIITFGLFIIKPKGIIKLSIYAFLLSLPITVYNNYEINIISIIINIIIVPFISIIFYPLILLDLLVPVFSNIVTVLINIIENPSNNLFNNVL